MKKTKVSWVSAAFVAMAAIQTLAGCGGSSGSSGSGSGSGSSSGSSTTSGMTCSHAYSCSGSSCSCDDGPKKGSSCCDPMDMNCPDNKCDTFCNHCM